MGEEKKDDDPHLPSSARRRQLRDADGNNSTIPTVSNFFPLERYYEASDKVLQSFEAAFQAKRLDEAYVYGMRYCTFCVKGIVNHDYYKSQKFAARKAQTNLRVDAVLKKMERVAQWMDEQEIEQERIRLAILKKQKEERLRKQRELEAQRMAELERRIAAQKISYSSPIANKISAPEGEGGSGNVEESALAKLQRLSQPAMPPPPVPAPQEQQDPKRRVSFQIDEDRQQPVEPDGHSFSTASGALPPPMLPPSAKNQGGTKTTSGDVNMAPPSYHQILANQTSYFGPGAVSPNGPNGNESTTSTAPSYDSLVKKGNAKPKTSSSASRQPSTKSKPLTMRKFVALADRRYREYQQKGLIQISALRTFQGRIPGSTNGCTVISACVVSKHLQTRVGVTDDHVQSVIDRDCVPLLKAIRSKLGLGSGSLIIPSDVHDHMVDHNLLHQHKFVGAAGGNICDPNHLNELYKMLHGEVGKTQALKAGATLFFREHVISIVKFPTSATEAVYDMVDSLPICQGRASRTRCTSLAALKVQLDWYTSHKFSDSNITYVERNRWDDSMADFDPRVFQAFVWADLPKPAKSE